MSSAEIDPIRARLVWILSLTGAIILGVAGCRTDGSHTSVKPDAGDYRKTALEIDYPDVTPTRYDEVAGPMAPRTIAEHAQVQYRDISLEEAIRLGLRYSKVMIDLGGTVLRSPDTTRTTFDPAVQETDPQFGVEAALAAFDAQFNATLSAQRNDQQYNNQFVGNLGLFTQNYDLFQAAITKQAATGSQFTVRQNIDFDHNSNLGNLFPGGAWDLYYEADVRHPLLRRSGVEYNRIAGPNGQPGVYNGVLVARIRTDISLADFEIGVRDLVSNVENAYWDLYFAYRDLDTKIRARDLALETWRRVYALYRTGRRGGEAEKEAQAREQFFSFEELVQNALAGRPLEGTRTNNGTSPGTFRAIPGVYLAEKRLRLITGLPPNDRCLLRPADEPPLAPVSFEWSCIASEAMVSREELRRQRWQIKSRELELVAAKNFLLPDLDFVGMYRWRGFGTKLADFGTNLPPFDNAFDSLTSENFQEWQAGLEFSMPLGFRQGHAAVRNAQVRLVQAHAILREQERQVANDLSIALGELDRAYTVLQTEISRVIAAKHQLEALQAAYDADKVDFYVVLDAQRRFAEAESQYYQARVEYVIALRNVHYEKGSLLSYCGVVLSETRSPEKAYVDAAQHQRQRLFQLPTDYRFDRPNIVSPGPVHPSNGNMSSVGPAGQVPTSAPPSPAVRPGPDQPPPETLPPGPTDTAPAPGA
jgi:hypothetical protein